MPATLYFIVGPTAVGKTELALAWAEAHDAEILSCDSLLVYQGMDIGTAKPTPEEQRRVPHHGIDLTPVNHRYSVSEYLLMAQRTVEDVLARGRNLLITGGSGFYLKSFFAPVMDRWEISPAIRARVIELYEKEGLDGLRQALLALNPAGTGHLDMNNPRRVQNALMRCLVSGRNLSELQELFSRQEPPFQNYNKKVCLLQRDREDLKARAARRVRLMLEAGLVEEVRRLRAAGLDQNPSAASAIGYRSTLACLDGKLKPELLEAAIIQETSQLIKKQATWFKKHIPVDRQVFLPPGKVGDPSDLWA